MTAFPLPIADSSIVDCQLPILLLLRGILALQGGKVEDRKLAIGNWQSAIGNGRIGNRQLEMLLQC